MLRQLFPCICYAVCCLPLVEQHIFAGDVLGGLIHFETTSDPLVDPTGDPGAPLTYGFGDESFGTPSDNGSPLQSDYHLPSVFFHQSDPDDEWRHIGKGLPLQGTSWLNRPLHAGWFVGGMIGDELISGRVDQTEDVFGGYRLGWDWDHYWGSEVRVAFARPDLADSLPESTSARDWFLDANFAYYPWGDSQWRPYLSAGMGIATFRFRDDNFVEHDNTLLHVPLGGGVKYLHDRWLALRFDVTDNIALGGGGIDTMHNITYTIGMEAHLGPKSPRKYFPY